jgi:hypothetical protein
LILNVDIKSIINNLIGVGMRPHHKASTVTRLITW